MTGFRRKEVLEKLRSAFRSEKNIWKRRKLRGEIKSVCKEIKLLESFRSQEGDPLSPKGASRRKKLLGGRAFRQKEWRVLRAALAAFLLGKSPRDFSPLRGLLISGAGTEAVSLPAPVPGAGAMDAPMPPAGAGASGSGGIEIPRPQIAIVRSG